MNRRRAVIILSVILVIISILLISLSLLSYLVPKANSWAFDMTQINRLHKLGFDGSGVTIGIVDTGVDSYHQEFDISSFVAWNDSINEKSEYYDDSDHGTHIAGILVSKGSFQGLLSGVNIQGIAPGVQLIVAKSISRNDCVYGGGDENSIADGIKFCIDNGADIICLSFGKNPEELILKDDGNTALACIQAINEGIFVVAPAGNDGQNDDGDVAFVIQSRATPQVIQV